MEEVGGDGVGEFGGVVGWIMSACGWSAGCGMESLWHCKVLAVLQGWVFG